MKVSDIICNCGQLLGQRQGDWLIYHSLRVLIVKSQPIVCPDCGTTTYLKRDRKKRIDTKAEIAIINRN